MLKLAGVGAITPCEESRLTVEGMVTMGLQAIAVERMAVRVGILLIIITAAIITAAIIAAVIMPVFSQSAVGAVNGSTMRMYHRHPLTVR